MDQAPFGPTIRQSSALVDLLMDARHSGTTFDLNQSRLVARFLLASHTSSLVALGKVSPADVVILQCGWSLRKSSRLALEDLSIRSDNQSISRPQDNNVRATISKDDSGLSIDSLGSVSHSRHEEYGLSIEFLICRVHSAVLANHNERQ